MIKSINKIKSQSGMALIISLILLLMLAIIGITSITTSNTDMNLAENEYRATGAFYAAEAGLEKAAARLKTSFESTGAAPDPLPSDSVSEYGHTYGYAVVDNGPAAATQLAAGAYKGLYGKIKIFTVNSLGKSNVENAGVELQMQIADALIPIFQFAVFYEHDLEIAPSTDMILGGRVHTNGDIYIQAGSDLYIDSYMTAAGLIYHGRKPGSGQSVTNSDVWINDENGVPQTMKNFDNTFLDSSDPDWVIESLNRWGGTVEDGSHGITQLYMPVVSEGPATNLIDRGAGNPDSYENKAGLKIIDGVAYYNSGGSWVDITANLTSQGIMTSGNFHDGREDQDVQSIDIDIDKLNHSAYFPPNGVLYGSVVESETQVNAFRLVNGQELSSALTVATDNPLYTAGDYNSVNKKAAALITDALTILSNGWVDADSWSDLDRRRAAATVVNACIMTGNIETGSSGTGYSGGFENLARFLEDWNNIDFTWRGSAVDLWYSRQNTGAWGGDYYRPPNRNWAFDSDLLDPDNLPPGTPVINIIQRMNWKQRVLANVDIGTILNKGL